MDNYEYELEVGTLLYNIYNGNWAKIIKKNGTFGIKWCDKNSSVYGIYEAGLDKKSFNDVWYTAGSKRCPKVPKGFNYEPPSNQGREFCFWHSDIKTKTKYVKTLDLSFNYCPKCKR
jgi:hypothetical protein